MFQGLFSCVNSDKGSQVLNCCMIYVVKKASVKIVCLKIFQATLPFQGTASSIFKSKKGSKCEKQSDVYHFIFSTTSVYTSAAYYLYFLW